MTPTTRSKQVPQNILNVEFKLFDFMTLKQFTMLCIASGLAFLFFSILDGLFKFLVPVILVIVGIIVAFSKFNGETFAVYVTNFMLAILSPQKRIWKKNNSSIQAVNDIGLLLPKTYKDKRPSEYSSYINSDEVDMPNLNTTNPAPANQNDLQKTVPTSNVVHDVVPNTTKIQLPDSSVNDTDSVTTLDLDNPSSNLVNENQTTEPVTPVNNVVNTVQPVAVEPAQTLPVVEPVQAPITPDVPKTEAVTSAPIDEPSFLHTETPSTPVQSSPKIEPETTEMTNDQKKFKVYVEDMSGSPLDAQVVLIQNTNGIPVNAKVSANGYVEFDVPEMEGDYFITVASNGNYQFERKKVSISDMLSTNVRITIRAIKSQEIMQQAKPVEPPRQEPVEFESEHSVRALTSPVGNPDLHLPPEPAPAAINKDEIIDMNTLQEAVEVQSIDKNVPNTINGVVKDTEGHYLQGVIIAIKNEDQMIVRALSTNQLGQFFSHSPIYVGKYIVELEKEGYKFGKYSVNIDNKVIPVRVFIAEKEEAKASMPIPGATSNQATTNGII